jgi:hypothetical protein
MVSRSCSNQNQAGSAKAAVSPTSLAFSDALRDFRHTLATAQIYADLVYSVRETTAPRCYAEVVSLKLEGPA